MQLVGGIWHVVENSHKFLRVEWKSWLRGNETRSTPQWVVCCTQCTKYIAVGRRFDLFYFSSPPFPLCIQQCSGVSCMWFTYFAQKTTFQSAHCIPTTFDVCCNLYTWDIWMRTVLSLIAWSEYRYCKISNNQKHMWTQLLDIGFSHTLYRRAICALYTCEK